MEDFAEKYGFRFSKTTQERIASIVRYKITARHENKDGILEDLLDEIED